MQSDKELFVCSFPEYQEKRESTTFFSDFSIADRFGVGAVKDTYRRAFGQWKHDYRYLTELVMALNHKIWQWSGRNDELANLYNSLWEEADKYGVDNLKGEEARFFFAVLD